MADKGFVHRTVPIEGGGHRLIRQPVNIAPTPVTIARAPQSRLQKLQGSSRLGTPAAFVMLLGLILVYMALHGWDKKYGTFGGAFAGKGAIPGAASVGGGTPPKTSSTVAPPASSKGQTS